MSEDKLKELENLGKRVPPDRKKSGGRNAKRPLSDEEFKTQHLSKEMIAEKIKQEKERLAAEAKSGEQSTPPPAGIQGSDGETMLLDSPIPDTPPVKPIPPTQHVPPVQQNPSQVDGSKTILIPPTSQPNKQDSSPSTPSKAPHSTPPPTPEKNEMKTQLMTAPPDIGKASEKQQGTPDSSSPDTVEISIDKKKLEKTEETDETEETEEPVKVTAEDFKTISLDRATLEAALAKEKPAFSLSSSTRTLLLIVVLLLAVLFYFMLRQNDTIIDMTDTAADDSAKVTDAQRGTPAGPQSTSDAGNNVNPLASILKPKKEIKQMPVYDLPDNVFLGSAPLAIKEKGPVISEDKDPEITALVDAFLIRTRIISGVKTQSRRGIQTETVNGSFYGFRLSKTLQRKGDTVIKDQTVLTTPSRGTVILQGNILDDIKRTSYEKIIEELGTAGLEMTKQSLPDENIINVQLRVTKVYGKPIPPEFLIGENNVGGVSIGMPVSEMKTLLNKRKYIVVSRKILEGDTYYDTYKVNDRKNKPLFFVIEKNNRVWRLQIINPDFRTSLGIGIGNTLDHIRMFSLLNAKLKVTSTISGAPFLLIEGMKGRFNFKPNGFNLKNNVFPGEAKVTDIVLGGSFFEK